MIESQVKKIDKVEHPNTKPRWQDDSGQTLSICSSS